MKPLKTLCIILLIACSAFQAKPVNKGHLVIIGGGKRDEYLMKKFVELAGGADSKIIVIPMASSEPIETAKAQIEELKTNCDCNNIDYIFCSKENADEPANLQKISDAKGIYFTGGDQVLLTKALLGTRLFDKIKEIYKNGGVIGGTSAGAAIMSKVMITGNENINKDTTNIFSMIKKGNVETVEGFGFINTAIIDQHFVVRKRLNRLVNVVLENPKLLGIGIDESTSIIVNPDETLNVLGESIVVVLEALNPKSIVTDKNGNLSAQNIKMHLLKSGDSFNLKTKKIIPAKG